MSQELDVAIDKLIEYWQQQNIRIIPSTPEEVVRKMALRGITLPADFVAFYSKVSGMPPEMMGNYDKDGFCFFSLDEIPGVEEEISLWTLKPVDSAYMVLVDFLCGCWSYGLEIKIDGSYMIGISHSKYHMQTLTNSLAEFITLYLDNSPELYDYDCGRRIGTSEFSELNSKYLGLITFGGDQYYTIAGSDKETEDKQDKVLVNDQNKWWLFKPSISMMKIVGESEHVFDKERSHAWVNGLGDYSEPYFTLNFDDFSEDASKSSSRSVLENLYVTFGIIKDYAIQVEHTELLDIIDHPLMEEFFDVMSGHFLWKVDPRPSLDIDWAGINILFKQIYTCLQNSIAIEE